MGLFHLRVDPRDNLIAILRSELSDLRAAVSREREQFEADRRELLDRVIALAQPLVLREMRRTSPGTAPTPATNRVRYPGGDLRVAPPYLPFKPELSPPPRQPASVRSEDWPPPDAS